MIKRIAGFLLLTWSVAVLIKSLLIHPTIFTKIHFYGLTSYLMGNLIANIIAAIVLFFSIRWLFAKSQKQQAVSQNDGKNVIQF
jgi:uncharacterized membrane protein